MDVIFIRVLYALFKHQAAVLYHQIRSELLCYTSAGDYINGSVLSL